MAPGRTPFSRGGDGKAALGPVIREYIVSEAMAALGVPTTRALAAVTTGEAVVRPDGRLPGAVFTRVAASHIRVGTFEYFRVRNDLDALRLLARTEGIIPAIESAHALAGALRIGRDLGPDAVILVNLSGRGDKDMVTAGEWFDLIDEGAVG